MTTQQDIPDLIAGALGVSRGTAYDMMREALAEQPAQQEPIYQYKLANGSWIDQTKESHDYNVRHGQATVRVVYTSPPAQRTWVGLTDEEQTLLWEISRAALPRYATFYRLIEAKLKEKNT